MNMMLFVCVCLCVYSHFDKLKATEPRRRREGVIFLSRFLYHMKKSSSCAPEVELNCRCPSSVSLPLYSCLTSFNSLPRLDKKTTEGGVCACVCVYVCERVYRVVL